MLGFKLHRNKPWPINASEFFGYTPEDAVITRVLDFSYQRASQLQLAWRSNSHACCRQWRL
jgi:hypothetical protein